MTEDSELLRRYAEDRSESAFAELVTRRVGLVYSVALRQVGGDAHLAQDVTQRVFADLARKAAALAGRPVLSGWLYRSAQFAASDIVRSERRRRVREQENHIMDATVAADGSDNAVDWDKLRPVLDEAMGELNDEDRDAVALRFLEEKPFAEIGRRLAISEEAARKRVSRALDQLHDCLARRGVTSTTAALAVALGSQAAAVPAGLAASVATAALAGAGTWAGAAMIFMSTKMFGVGTSAVAVVAIGVAMVEVQRGRQREKEFTAQIAQQQALQAKLAATERRAAEAEADAEQLLAAIQTRVVAPLTGVPASATDDEPMTHDVVLARWRRAQELARTGDPAEALRELLWCFDTGMVRVSSFVGVRASSLLSELAKLGERHPAALAALRERREKAEKRVLASATDFEARSVFASINRVLGEHERTLTVLDQLPAGDARRGGLAMVAFEPLRERRRYSEAMEGFTVSRIMQDFDRKTEERTYPADAAGERLKKANLSYAITSTAKQVEVLAGAGKLPEARTLANRLLAYDATAETRTLVQTHLARAGQPNLLPAAGR